MNVSKVLYNVLGAAAACLTTHAALNGSLAAAVSAHALIATGLCVGANLVGLFQSPPTTP